MTNLETLKPSRYLKYETCTLVILCSCTTTVKRSCSQHKSLSQHDGTSTLVCMIPAYHYNSKFVTGYGQCFKIHVTNYNTLGLKAYHI